MYVANFRTSFYTGPTIVGQIAQKMRDAGVRVTVEGTERVHCIVEASNDIDDDIDARLHVLEALREKHGTTFGLDARDGQVYGSPWSDSLRYK